LTDSSRNVLSSYLLLFSIFFYAARYFSKRTFSPLVATLSFIGCIELYGRSGIALSAILLLAIAFIRYRTDSRILLLLICAATLSIIASLLLANLDSLAAFISEGTNLKRGLESERYRMWSEYISFMDVRGLFFGESIEKCCSTMVAYGTNPHNAFIAGHAKHGLIHTIIFALIYMYVILNRRLLPIFFMTIIYIRYFLDTLGLFAPYDFIIFYIALSIYPYKLDERSSSKIAPSLARF